LGAQPLHIGSSTDYLSTYGGHNDEKANHTQYLAHPGKGVSLCKGFVMKKQTILNILLILLVLGFSVAIIQAAPAERMGMTSPLSVPSRFDSPLSPPSPYSCSSVASTSRLTIEVRIEGLKGKHSAELQLLPDGSQTAACLSADRTKLLKLSVRNGNRSITITDIPDGSYKLAVDAPANYFREPQGYLLQVSEGQIVRHSDLFFHFELIPPSAQDLPPCRNVATQPDTPTHDLVPEDVPSEPQVVCRAERLVDVSGPSKQPEPQEGGVLDVGYHYAGPTTYQDSQGVWGRRYVVDPLVSHSFLGPSQHVVEYSYANDSSYDRWMETGWAEVSWRDDRQYVYEFDSATHTWHFFDQFALSTGSAVETLVEYRPDAGTWWALYYLGDSSWALLAEEMLDFTVADHGYNWGEIYIDGGAHPILPISRFDKGYLKMNDVWRIWNTRYLTEISRDTPYQCDVIEQYYCFNIHSPMVFLPLVMKDQ
jgi:uncharacterized membrane protein YqaE (UPF0057 family)